MKIYDFNDLKESNIRYSGNAGLKKGVIIDNERWFLKFPKNTSAFNNAQVSYTTSSLSEYLGSNIYKSIGIDVHETVLGIYKRKLVVACKDFNRDNEYLDEYTSIKNDYVEGLDDVISSGSGPYTAIEEIMMVMDSNPVFRHVKGLKEHFWDMFVIDAFIGNNDRNNGNWGGIVNKLNGEQRIAPVYDNGNSFNNKSSDEQIHKLLSDKIRFKQSVYDSRICTFTENDKIINPLKFIESEKTTECSDAILRICPKINMEIIRDIIKEIPEEFNGIKVMSEVQKEFYIKTLEYRYENVIKKTYTKLMEREKILSDPFFSLNSSDLKPDYIGKEDKEKNYLLQRLTKTEKGVTKSNLL